MEVLGGSSHGSTQRLWRDWSGRHGRAGGGSDPAHESGIKTDFEGGARTTIHPHASTMGARHSCAHT